MTFVPIEIDACPAFGWSGGPTIDIDIKRLRSGHQRRNFPANFIPHEFTLPFKNIRSGDYLRYIKSAYFALGGPLITFLCKDYGDHWHGPNNRASDEPMEFAAADGVETHFQLRKTYTFTDGVTSISRERDITKPKVDTVTIWMDTGSGWVDITATVDVDPLTGDVSFGSSPPPEDAVLGWTGEFRCCVQFTDFKLPATIDDRFGDDRQYAVNGSCTLAEVPGE